jgi:hypothetical protein
VLAALGVASGTAAMAATPLTLVNGWTNAPFSTRAAMVRTISNVVRFSGAIANGSSAVAFTLPSGYWPTTDVYVHIDLCNSTNGRLHITPSGVTDIEEEDGTLVNAQCFTSLDGASFALTADRFHTLTLRHGWTGAPFSTSAAAVREVDGVVEFKGAVASGSSAAIFTLPVIDRPSTNVYVPVDLCNATKGRLIIAPTGLVQVQAETSFSNAQCFTSLDGASFAATASGYTTLTLINGWTAAPFGTSAPAAAVIGGVTHFKGAMSTSGTSSSPFVMPVGMRPRKDVYIPIDLCNATNGRLHITPSGAVDIEEENNTFSNAQCFTSLDGASFVN